MAVLRRIEGPECYKCGCRDCRSIGSGAFFGKAFKRYVCNHCQHQFKYDEDSDTQKPSLQVIPPMRKNGVPCVRYRRGAKCPKCSSWKTRTTDTVLPYRYHRCNDCGKRFKSVQDD